MKVHVKRQVYILLILLLLLVIIGLVAFDMLQRKSVSLTVPAQEVTRVEETTMQTLLDQIKPKTVYDGTRDALTLQGVVVDGMTIFANGVEVAVYQDNSFDIEIELVVGANSINIVAVNSIGQQVSREIIITRDVEVLEQEVIADETAEATQTQQLIEETNNETNETQSVPACDQGSFATQFLCYINEHRVANGKAILQLSADLTGVAQGHSEWMDANNLLSHDENDGKTAADRCDAADTVCYAENVAYGFRSAKHLFELWRDSAGHNANMLGDYSLLGIGVTDEYATSLFR